MVPPPYTRTLFWTYEKSENEADEMTPDLNFDLKTVFLKILVIWNFPPNFDDMVIVLHENKG